MKALVIVVDGMRPDALIKTENAKNLLENSKYTLNARTVTPSVTLPCHMSMQHGVYPESHGVFTNTYTPSLQLVDGIAETAYEAGKKCAFFYDWVPLGDVIDSGALIKEECIDGAELGWEESFTAITSSCKEYISNNQVDYTFLYMGYTDEWGHKYGWLSEEYFNALNACLEAVFDLISSLPEDYTVIITADHGGNGFSHGSDSTEDMTIPILLIGKEFAKNTEFTGGSILDIAPTVADILGIESNNSWVGRSLK
jgi:predicted AlkP superfamily pyrophosphatase or phosphodiesterase